MLGTGDSVIFTRGNKLFELSNHLGNVLATISDKRYGVSPNGSTVSYFNPEVVSANDYYPFGSLQPGRSYVESNAGNYRYGFNGKEQDPEVEGPGNWQDYGMRAYDPRIGRFASVDPLTQKYPYYSPYQFAANNPIVNVDVDGLEQVIANKAQGKAGELFVRSKLRMTNAYRVYEQVTVRPAGTTKVDNTINDFLVRNEKTGEFYKIEIKTGDAVPSTNQGNLDNTISKGDPVEMRSGKPDISEAIPKGDPFDISGSITAQVDPKTGQVNVQSKIANPNYKGAVEEMNGIENILKAPNQQGTISQIIKDAQLPEILAPAKLPSLEPIVPAKNASELPIEFEPPPVEIPAVEIIP